MNKQAIVLSQLVEQSNADPSTKHLFSSFLSSGQITKDIHPAIHACVFFIPIHKASHSLYLIHHKKAEDWIPPGGHIEPMELPLATVLRESQEELGYTPPSTDIEFATISIKHINNTFTCKTHYDFWFVIHMHEKKPFTYLQTECFDAKWYDALLPLTITKEPDQRRTITKIASSYLGAIRV